jgi:uncharacterized membrane protein
VEELIWLVIGVVSYVVAVAVVFVAVAVFVTVVLLCAVVGG